VASWLAAGTGEAGQRAQRSIDLRSLQDRRDDTAHATDDCHEQRDKQIRHLVEACVDAEETLVDQGEAAVNLIEPVLHAFLEAPDRCPDVINPHGLLLEFSFHPRNALINSSHGPSPSFAGGMPSNQMRQRVCQSILKDVLSPSR
jgi:hypothetical protein